MLRSFVCVCALLAGAAASGAAAETPAPADPTFAASCRREASVLLHEARLEFDRPTYSRRDGTPTVRMALRLTGQPRDGDDSIEVSCARDADTGAVSAAVIDAAADGIGPRVIVLRGPDAAMRPRPQAPAARRSASIDGGIVLWRLYPPAPGFARRPFVSGRHRPVSPPFDVHAGHAPPGQVRQRVRGPLPAPAITPFFDGRSDHGIVR